MCVLRRIVDIANAAVKRARPPGRFAKSSDKQFFLSDSELSDLTDAVAGVTSEHLAVHRHDFIHTIPRIPNLISYIPVATEQNVTMAVFVMPPGSEIPLHDHAHMYVVTSVLWGTLDIHEYDPLHPDAPAQMYQFPAVQQPVSTIVPGVARSLTPDRGNIHSFRVSDWTAVFDVLIPPYDPDAGRNCHYFTPLQLEQSDSQSDPFQAKQVILEHSRCPDTYNTTHVDYKGIPLES